MLGCCQVGWYTRRMGRIVCKNCERPRSTCLCPFLRTLPCPLELVILQDPSEARHAMSTGPLLARSIEGARLLVGEVFDPVALFGEQWQAQSVLVYPAETPTPGGDARLEVKRVILLDGTWRKVRRLRYCNPWLDQLAKLSLRPQERSAYRIRKSPRADGLSTIEAGALALNQLVSGTDYRDILGVFTAMVEMQINAMGPAAAKNHPP